MTDVEQTNAAHNACMLEILKFSAAKA
jgi:hypothetical protein